MTRNRHGNRVDRERCFVKLAIEWPFLIPADKWANGSRWQGHPVLEAAHGAPVGQSTSFFLVACHRKSVQRQWPPSYLSICGIDDEGDSSKCCASPSPDPPAFPPTALRLTKYYVAAPENTISRMYHRVPCTTTSLSLVSVYVYVHVRTYRTDPPSTLSGYAENELVDG